MVVFIAPPQTICSAITIPDTEHMIDEETLQFYIALALCQRLQTHYADRIERTGVIAGRVPRGAVDVKGPLHR
jgi:hypothetical protein